MSASDESLADVVRGQAALIADLQARLDRLESDGNSANANPLRAASHSVQTSNDMVVDPPSRRGFLRLAGAAAAGAAVAVVGNASPAAALDGGSFTGAETVFNNNGTDSTKAGVKGNFTGSTSNGIGGIGVLGQSDLLSSGAGVIGTANLGYGVYGTSATGYALYAASNGRLGFDPHLLGTAAPTTGGYKLGDIVMNANGDTFSCVVAGSGGSAKFRKLAGPLTAGSFHSVTPVRVFDSRSSSAFGVGETRTISVASVVPSSQKAVAATINVTVTGTAGSFGFLTAYPADASLPDASVINWSAPGQSIANGATVKLGTNNDLKITCSVNSTHVIIDVAGYWL